MRRDILEKIAIKLSKKTVTVKTFVSNSNYHYFLKGLDKGQTPEPDPDKIRLAQSRDGFYAIVSNVKDKMPIELFAQYKELWMVGDCFGELNEPCALVLSFTGRDKRIVGHLTLWFIAMLCEAHVTHAMRDNHDRYRGRAVADRIIKPRQLSAATVLRELAEVRAIPIKIGTRSIWVRTDVKGRIAKLFQSLGLRIPPKLISQEATVAQDNQTSVTY